MKLLSFKWTNNLAESVEDLPKTLIVAQQPAKQPKTPLSRSASSTFIAPTLAATTPYATTTPSLSRQVSTSSVSGFSLLRRSSARRTRAVDIVTELIIVMPGEDPLSRLNLDAQETIEFQVLMENPMEGGYYTDCDNTADHQHGPSHSHTPSVSGVNSRVVRELSNYFDGSVAGHKPVSTTTLQEVYVPGVTQRVTTQDVLVKLKSQFDTNPFVPPPTVTFHCPPPVFIPTPAVREVRPPPPPKPVKQLTMTQNANRTADGRIVKSGRGYISKATAAAMLLAAELAVTAVKGAVDSTVADNDNTTSTSSTAKSKQIDLGPALQVLATTPLWPVTIDNAPFFDSTTTATATDTANNTADTSEKDNRYTNTIYNNNINTDWKSAPTESLADESSPPAVAPVVSSDTNDSSGDAAAMEVQQEAKQSVSEEITTPAVTVDDSAITTAIMSSAVDEAAAVTMDESATLPPATETADLIDTNNTTSYDSSTSSSGRTSSRVRKSVTPFSPCEYDDVSSQLHAPNPLLAQPSTSTTATPVSQVALSRQQQEERSLAEVIAKRRASGYFRECPGSVALVSSGIVS
eukprot:gene28629-35518_t